MKKYFCLSSFFILIFAFNHQAQVPNTDNPFFNEWKTPFQTPPFSEIKHEHFLTAYEEGIKKRIVSILSLCLVIEGKH